jgi:quercetin dioxygenase-like cupin family protein
MSSTAQAKIVRAAEAEKTPLGPLSHRQHFTGDDSLPVLTGIQIGQPGYRTKLHSHPYPEYLLVPEGEMEAWLQGQKAAPSRLGPGDTIVLSANVPHVFRNPGTTVLRHLGIDTSPTRIVHNVE